MIARDLMPRVVLGVIRDHRLHVADRQGRAPGAARPVAGHRERRGREEIPHVARGRHRAHDAGLLVGHADPRHAEAAMVDRDPARLAE
jgi:hypothetical protein